MYFFDTFAIIEVIKGNKNYERFKDFNIITSILNVGELYYIHLKEYNKKTADFWYKKIKFDLVEIAPEIIVKAMYFRFLNKEKNLSLVDCVGYILALSKQIKFLTGDKEFKDLPNVEFVK